MTIVSSHPPNEEEKIGFFFNIVMPAPVIRGTFAYFGIAAAIIAIYYLLSKRGTVTKDTYQIVSVVTLTLTVSCWLMWLCTWMHQWHPLIAPIYKAE